MIGQYLSHTNENATVSIFQKKLELRGCLVPIFSQKFLGFDPSFCKMELNTMQKNWQKDSYSLFWKTQNEPQESRLHDNNKFCILDVTKHDFGNFGIFVFHHSKVVVILYFEFYGGTKHPLNKALTKFLLFSVNLCRFRSTY
jgi:hypothetical protein